MNTLSEYNHNIEGSDFLSAHRVLQVGRVKESLKHLVGEKRDVISHATANWIHNLEFEGKEQEVIQNLFSHLFELEEKCKMAEEKLAGANEKAYFCGLTKSLNRTFFNEFVDSYEKRREISEEDFSTYFFYLDLNKFKEINDTHGHEVGDEVLIEFSNRLSSVIRSEDNRSFDVEKLIKKDFFARTGGDEFIGKIELTSEEDAEKLKKRIQEKMKTPFETNVGPLTVGVSVGYQQIKKGINVKEVLKQADKKMYEDKRK